METKLSSLAKWKRNIKPITSIHERADEAGSHAPLFYHHVKAIGGDDGCDNESLSAPNQEFVEHTIHYTQPLNTLHLGIRVARLFKRLGLPLHIY